MVSVLATVAVLGRSRIGEVAQGEGVAAGAQIDAGVGDRSSQNNAVRTRTGGERIDRYLKVAVLPALPRLMTTDTAHLLGKARPGTGRFVLPPGVAALLRERQHYASDVKK